MTFDAGPAHDFRILHERLILNRSDALVAVEGASIRALCNISPSARLFRVESLTLTRG